MTRADDLAAALTSRWTDVYTSGIEADVRDARRAEIASDLWEHRREAEQSGLRSSQIGLEIGSRWLLGIPADLSWRRAAPRAVAAMEGGDPRMARSWWVVSALVLAAMHLYVGITSLDPGWIPPAPPIDPFAVVIIAFGIAGVVGVTLRNRMPKLAGLLVLAGVWVPLLVPVVALTRIFLSGGSVSWGPTWYLGPIGVVVAVLAAIGAVQNMSRRPVAGVRRPA